MYLDGLVYVQPALLEVSTNKKIYFTRMSGCYQYLGFFIDCIPNRFRIITCTYVSSQALVEGCSVFTWQFHVLLVSERASNVSIKEFLVNGKYVLLFNFKAF